MKNIFRAMAGAMLFVTPATATALSTLPCEDRDIVMSIFEEQGTEYRFTVQGPNRYLVQIYENMESGRYIMLRVDDHNNRVCAQGHGDYDRLVKRLGRNLDS